MDFFVSYQFSCIFYGCLYVFLGYFIALTHFLISHTTGQSPKDNIQWNSGTLYNRIDMSDILINNYSFYLQPSFRRMALLNIILLGMITNVLMGFGFIVEVQGLGCRVEVQGLGFREKGKLPPVRIMFNSADDKKHIIFG